MKSRIVMMAFTALVWASPAAAMPLEEFLTKATTLEKKGPLALFSPDFKILRKEFEKASLELHKERERDIKAGRQPAYCPRKDTKPAPITEVLAYFRTIPQRDRAGMELKDGFRRYLAHKIPC